jgi:hypothetical protein
MTTAPPITCCQEIPGSAAHDVAGSLLSHVFVTEYYDGATGGLLQCPVCGSVYHFITLDWSRNHWVRVIALARLPPDSMTRIEAFFSEVPSRSPWIPTRLRRASDQDLDSIERFLSEITARAEPPGILLAWDVSTNRVLAARKIDTPSADHAAGMFDPDAPADRRRVDWFAELGVSRDG